MKRIATLSLLLMGLLLVPTQANGWLDGDVTVEVTGAYANNDWTEVSIENITFGYPDFDGDGKWYGLVGVEPNATGCPRDIFKEGTNNVWTTGFQTTPKTLSSGPRTYPLNGSHGQRLCFHLVQMRANGVIENEYRGAKLFEVKPPEPPPSMTTSEAKLIAKGKLARKFGKSWKRGQNKRVTCRELTTIFNCKADWKFNGNSKHGSVLVKNDRLRFGGFAAVPLSVALGRGV